MSALRPPTERDRAGMPRFEVRPGVPTFAWLMIGVMVAVVAVQLVFWIG